MGFLGSLEKNFISVRSQDCRLAPEEGGGWVELREKEEI